MLCAGGPCMVALPMNWRADKKQSLLRRLRNLNVVSEGDFASCQSVASATGHPRATFGDTNN
jgi:hypothetical protein